MASPKMEYTKWVMPLQLILGVSEWPQRLTTTQPWKKRPKSLQSHPWSHVLRQRWMAAMGAKRRRRATSPRTRLQSRHQHLGHRTRGPPKLLATQTYRDNRQTRTRTGGRRKSSARRSRNSTSRATALWSSRNATSASRRTARSRPSRRCWRMTATWWTRLGCRASTFSTPWTRAWSAWAHTLTCCRSTGWIARRRGRRSWRRWMTWSRAGRLGILGLRRYVCPLASPAV